MKMLSFIYQYITNPRSVGAILPSSSFLSERMVEGILFEQAKYIVEYGPGTGVFTEYLLRKKNKKTTLILFENNLEFLQLLKEKFGQEEKVIIVNESAEFVEKTLKEHRISSVDYIVSGLPFSSLPEQVSEKILRSTRTILKPSGSFITFQYSKMKLPLLMNYFTDIKIKKELRNIPPAYILVCKNET